MVAPGASLFLQGIYRDGPEFVSKINDRPFKNGR
jgi:hypothetical protein